MMVMMLIDIDAGVGATAAAASHTIRCYRRHCCCCWRCCCCCCCSPTTNARVYAVNDGVRVVVGFLAVIVAVAGIVIAFA